MKTIYKTINCDRCYDEFRVPLNESGYYDHEPVCDDCLEEEFEARAFINTRKEIDYDDV